MFAARCRSLSLKAISTRSGLLRPLSCIQHRCYANQPYSHDNRIFMRPAGGDQSIVSYLEEAHGGPTFAQDIGFNKGSKEITPRSFTEFEDFMLLVHEILQARVQDSILLQTLAKTRQEGYIHISDERNPPEANRIPWPEDLLATLYVKNGKLDPETYEPSPTYRLVTAEGFMKLNQELHDMLLQGLRLAVKLQQDET